MSMSDRPVRSRRRPRIVIEHSGYDLLNIGDTAMLQACYGRVRGRWPDADIYVICYRPEVLEQYCPGAIPVGPPLRHARGMDRLPRKLRLASEQGFKTLLPLVPLRRVRGKVTDSAMTLRAAVSHADAVVGAGGGYLCDKFWWHALGVLASIRAAQRLGLPTAMFGQGIGPLRPSPIRDFMKHVISDLDVLTLREARTGGPLLAAMDIVEPSGMPTDDHPAVVSRFGNRIELTGDDAAVLALEASPRRDPENPVIGFNVRVGPDSELTNTSGIADAVLDWARRQDATVVVLPVSQYSTAEDFTDTVALLEAASKGSGQRIVAERMTDPRVLAHTAATCSVVVTGSYHGAVFALSQGCPVVMLVANDYYAQKSSGLAEIYPGLVLVVRTNRPDQQERLSEAVAAAWSINEETRAGGRRRTEEYRQAADRAFEEFADLVDQHMERKAHGQAQWRERLRAHDERQS